MTMAGVNMNNNHNDGTMMGWWLFYHTAAANAWLCWWRACGATRPSAYLDGVVDRDSGGAAAAAAGGGSDG